jgi:SAM-dependent methyltransferase
MSDDDDRVQETRRLAAGSLDDADPTAWFDRLYLAANEGKAHVPWDRGGPHPLLSDWVERRAPDGRGERALVVGCGLGDDAELIAELGYETVAFDISPTAIATAQARYPSSPVAYVVSSIFDLPDGWVAGFDFVFESQTVQSIPESMRADAMSAVRSTVGRGGRLLVIAAAREDDEPADGPPWPLRRAEIEAFATGGVEAVEIEDLRDQRGPWSRRWRAEFRR